MKTALIILLLIFTHCSFGQKNLQDEIDAVVAEGKLLYQSEMASWFGTDLFLSDYPDRQNIGGYFSYTEGSVSKCVFFSRTEEPKVIGTISFNGSYDPETATKDISERNFSSTERNLYEMRNAAVIELQNNRDGLFTFYENTNPNFIPIISNDERKVYILTGPKNYGTIIFGNDYLLTFDNNNQLKSKKQLHKNIIPIEFDNEEEGIKVESAMHSHLPETGELMTATDICTLMLYSKYTKWKSHNVVSKKYLNTWNCETNELTVVPMNAIKKIEKDQKKRNKKKK